jgi:hypothetical protein
LGLGQVHTQPVRSWFISIIRLVGSNRERSMSALAISRKLTQ